MQEAQQLWAKVMANVFKTPPVAAPLEPAQPPGSRSGDVLVILFVLLPLVLILLLLLLVLSLL